MNVPELAIGISATIEVVSAVSASGCPVEIGNNSITLNFIEAPTADAGDDDWVCDDGVLTLEGSIGGSATEGFWTTSGDGSFDDPNNLFADYTPGPNDIDNGEVTLTLTATDENGACTPAVSTIVVEVLPSWTIDVGPPQTVCNTDVVIVNAVVTGPPAAGYWNSGGDGEFDNPFAESTIYTPGPWDISQGMIVLHYGMVNSGPCTAPDEPLFITFVLAPEVDIPDNLEICEDENIIVTIDVEGNYTDVTWFAGGDGTLVVLNDFEVDYTPGPQDISNQFFILSVTVVSGFTECGQTTYNIPVNIIFCDCPPFETQPPSEPLCAENGQLDLNTLLVDGNAGDWSITNVPPGSNPATLSGDMFLVDNSDPGVYTVTYTLTNPEPGCPPTSSEMILVSAPVIPFAGPDITLCGVQSVTLTGSITPTGGAPVLWTTSGDGTFPACS